MPISSRHPDDTRQGDIITVPDHEGRLMADPHRDNLTHVALYVACVKCGQAHAVMVPLAQVITVERSNG